MTRTRDLLLGAAIIAVCAGAIWSACNESSLAPASPPSDTESTGGVDGRSDSPVDGPPSGRVAAQHRPEPLAPGTEDDDAIRRRALLFFMAQTLDDTNPDWMAQAHQVISDARIESSRREMLRAIVAAAGTDLGDAEKRYMQRNPRFFQQVGAKLRDESYFRGLRDKAIKKHRVRSGSIDNRDGDDCGGLPARVSTRATAPAASSGQDMDGCRYYCDNYATSRANLAYAVEYALCLAQESGVWNLPGFDPYVCWNRAEAAYAEKWATEYDYCLFALCVIP